MSAERPWEDFSSPVPSAAGSEPWKAFQNPIPQPVQAPPQQVGYGEDMLKGAAGGLGRGTSGLVGLPGTVGGLVRSGLSKAGVSDDTLDTGAGLIRKLPGPARMFTGPDGGDVQKAMENYTGPLYQPKTVPGQYASTAAEFAPAALIPGGGGLAARAVNTLIPAVASETAGQMTKGTAAEPWARAAGGVLGGLTGAKAITPMAPPTPQRAAMVATLDQSGIPLLAGQRTGSKALQALEAAASDMPAASGRAGELQAQQANAFDRAITEKMFDRGALTARGVPADMNLPSPLVAQRGKASLSDEYNRLAQNDLVSDPALQNALTNAQTKYEANVLPSLRSGGARDIEAIRNDIAAAMATNGTMPGQQYQALRTRLGTLAKASQSDPHLAGALKDMQGSLDAAMYRGLPPAEAAAWRLNNERWGAMKQTEGAVARGGENLSPAAVAQTARAGRVGQYAVQAGPLDELSNAARTVMKPASNSGTASRLGWQTLFRLPTLLSSGVGGAVGSAFGPLGAVAGVAAPQLLARTALSRPGQAYLGNQTLPQNARDIIAQTLAEQAISQPAVTTRNSQERADYERKRRGINTASLR